MNSGIHEKDKVFVEVSEHPVDGCRLGRLRLKIESDVLDEKANLAAEVPIRVFLPVTEYPAKITAMYLFNTWWTRPAFVERITDIPNRTQVAFFKYQNRFACFVPMVGNQFKAYLNGGTETELCLEMTAYCGGQSQVEEPLYVYAEGKTLAEAVHTVFAKIAEEKDICLRKKRAVPEMFHYLGCAVGMPSAQRSRRISSAKR